MAKQRGTHQISGTINNLVYYEQKYVKGGLIRRQNEAMPNRLKEDPVFANTREANSLFGGCMMVASALINSSTRRIQVFTKPSRNAMLTASILRMYQEENGTSKDNGIDISTYRDSSLLDATDRLMKTPVSRFFPSALRVFNNVTAGGDIDIDFIGDLLESYARYCGVSRLRVEATGPVFIGTSNKDATTQKFISPEVNLARLVTILDWNIGDGDLSFSIESPVNYTKKGFIFISILPVISGIGSRVNYKIKNAIGYYAIINYT